MRRLFRVLLLASLLAFPSTTVASVQSWGDIPAGFFTARRGRIVANRGGGWRLRYTQGVDWAGFSQWTNVVGHYGVQALPSIVSIVNPVGDLAPRPQSPGSAPNEEEDTDPFSEQTGGAGTESKIDLIIKENVGRNEKLDELLIESRELVERLGGDPRTTAETTEKPKELPSVVDDSGSQPAPAEPTSEQP